MIAYFYCSRLVSALITPVRIIYGKRSLFSFQQFGLAELTDVGNVRLTFSEKTTTTEYLATMEKEPSSIDTNENAMFLNMNSSKKLAFYNHTAGEESEYSYKLRGSSGEVVGPAKSMEVQAGDLVDLEVYARYANLTNTNSSVSTLLTSLIGAFSLNPSGGTGLTGEDAYSSFSTMFSSGPVVGNAIDYEDEEAPKAYLNYILFDKDFIPVDFGFDQVSESAASAHELLSLHVKVRQAGYLYVFLSNENDKVVDVWFDDFKIVHHTTVEQSNDYYAFGHVIGSLSFDKGGVDNKYLYNGKELQDELDLGWYDYGARMYMSDIGRWGAFDPLSEETRRLTPYNYALSNPLRYIDPDGMMSIQPTEEQKERDRQLEEWAANINERDAAIEKYGYRAYAIMALEGTKVTTEKKKKAEGSTEASSESNTTNDVADPAEPIDVIHINSVLDKYDYPTKGEILFPEKPLGKKFMRALERIFSFGTAERAVELVEPVVETANDVAENVHHRMEDAELGSLSNYVNILTSIQVQITEEMNGLTSKIADLNSNNATGFHTQEIASQYRALFVLEDYLAPVKSELRLASPILAQKRIVK